MKFVSKKINHVRKQNWSAPAIMSFFILCCMIVIYTVESVGLTNKEKNLEMRSNIPEIVIKKNSISNEDGKIISDNNILGNTQHAKEENNYEQMLNILMDGINTDDELTFYDI
jgi:hypothetical protein